MTSVSNATLHPTEVAPPAPSAAQIGSSVTLGSDRALPSPAQLACLQWSLEAIRLRLQHERCSQLLVNGLGGFSYATNQWGMTQFETEDALIWWLLTGDRSQSVEKFRTTSEGSATRAASGKERP